MIVNNQLISTSKCFINWNFTGACNYKYILTRQACKPFIELIPEQNDEEKDPEEEKCDKKIFYFGSKMTKIERTGFLKMLEIVF